MTAPKNPIISPPEQTKPEEANTKKKNALVIQFTSWSTPIVGLVMLGLGLVLGFSLRPETLSRSQAPTVDNPVEGIPEEVQSSSVQIPTPDQSAQQNALMDGVIAVTRHFKGDPDAPVTVIEFSDFQ